jgi:hypothetical protein
MMLYFSKKQNSITPKRQHSKVIFSKKIFVEEQIKTPENNQKELKGILKKSKYKNCFFIF